MKNGKLNILKSFRVLYVEDEDNIRNPVSKVLGFFLKEVVTANNGQNGLDKFKNEKFDLVITDITMPKLDGLEMSAAIREIDKDIPIIVTTAHSDSDFLRKAIEVGVGSYILKPIDSEKLLHGILKSTEHLILRRKLEELNQTLEQRVIDEVSKNKEKDILMHEIVEFQNNMLIVFNEKAEPIFANKLFLKLFHLQNLEDFIDRYQNVENLFIEHDDFFYPAKYKNDKNWLENLNILSPDERIVSTVDMLTFNTKAYLINLDFVPITNHWIASFSEFTKIAEDKKIFESKAYTDGLTQVNNRTKFNETFTKEIAFFRRYHNPLSLIIFDIDFFKKFNDTYGHQVGDDVLIELADIVNKAVRETDLFARWGGEEFVILVPSTNLDGGVILANNIREMIDNRVFKNEMRVQCSFGVAEVTKDDTQESALKRADDGLYKAKKEGRNQVAVI